MRMDQQHSRLTGFLGGLTSVLIGAASLAMAEDGDPKALLAEAEAAFRAGQFEEASAKASLVIEKGGDNLPAYLIRGQANERLKRYDDALADFNQIVLLAPQNAAAVDRRGDVNFKLGRIEAALADFNRSIELAPQTGAGHWRRGIVCYYAGQFVEGQKQFEGYQTVDNNDVENVVWRFLCMAQNDGAKVAQEQLLEARRDPRVPMREIHALFAGRGVPDEVFAASRNDSPDENELNERLFYAHLYVGLFYESQGQADASLKHIRRAVKEHPVSHYMWDVARVHLDLREKASAATQSTPSDKTP